MKWKNVTAALLALCLMTASMGAGSADAQPEDRPVVRVEQTYSTGSQYMPDTSTTLTGYDETGAEVWSWTSPTAGNQLQVSEITPFAENQHLAAVAVLSTLYIFDRQTGRIDAAVEDVGYPVQVVLDEQDRVYLAGYLGQSMLVYDREGTLLLDLDAVMPGLTDALYSSFQIEILDDGTARVYFEGAQDEDLAAAIAVKNPTQWEGEYNWYVDVDMDAVLPTPEPESTEAPDGAGA